MSRLIETIRCVDGQFMNLAYHEQRMRKALKEIYTSVSSFSLNEILSAQTVPSSGLFKCRLIYDNKSNSAEFIPYVARSVQSLKLVFDDSISYVHKLENRNQLEDHFGKRDKCDDVLIIKNGMVTDTSYANIVFKRGEEWITPSSYLLAGTMRQNLLDHALIREEKVCVDDIEKFESFKIVNAMLLFESEAASTKNILR